MIDFNEYSILKDNMSTLRDTSLDDHAPNSIAYMTNSSREAINFDNVKRKYTENLRLNEEPKSNDALFISDKGKLVFVEFKNGFMDGQKKFAVRKKIYDSIIT